MSNFDDFRIAPILPLQTTQFRHFILLTAHRIDSLLIALGTQSIVWPHCVASLSTTDIRKPATRAFLCIELWSFLDVQDHLYLHICRRRFIQTNVIFLRYQLKYITRPFHDQLNNKPNWLVGFWIGTDCEKIPYSCHMKRIAFVVRLPASIYIKFTLHRQVPFAYPSSICES